MGWTAFAFAGVYPSTLVVPYMLAVCLAVMYRPWRVRAWGALETCGVVAAAMALLQLVPLPRGVGDAISPHLRSVCTQISLSVHGALPLSIDPTAGIGGACTAIAALTVFLASAAVFESGGVRLVIRGIALTGVVLAAVGIAQDATAHGLMYWRWHPLEEGAPPFGPFVNRDHFATWVLLALPLTAGYFAAHTAVHQRTQEGTWRQRLLMALDGRAVWLAGAIALMAIALAATMSRSGLFGLSVAIIAAAVLRKSTHERGSGAFRWIAGAVAIALALGVARFDPGELVRRVAAAPASAANRAIIWRETMPIVHDFWLTGTGAGTYETAMLVYQRSSAGGARFNQAHNQFLQLGAEGGLLLSIPLALALLACWGRARRALASDASAMYWVRAGALCGLAGVAAQSLFETGLSTPANALLASVALAIAVHAPARRAPGAR